MKNSRVVGNGVLELYQRNQYSDFIVIIFQNHRIKLIFFHFIKYSETDGFNVKEKKIKSGIRNWTRLIML